MTKKNAPLKSSIEKKKTQPDFAVWAKEFLKATQDDGPSKQPCAPSTLMIVATPIGNLGDISLRALWALSQADAILCEDTRVTGGLLNLYGIKKQLIACHDHNEEARIGDVLDRLKRGESLALVSDAGTPLISDPGYKLVRACRLAGFDVIALPGSSALLTALASGGLPTDRFMFVGFLPSKKTARRKEIELLASTLSTLVFYESPQRLADTLADLSDGFLPTRQACVARELTKLYEEMRCGTLQELAAHYKDSGAPKGEIVILVGPPDAAQTEISETDIDAALNQALKTLSLRDAVAFVTEQTRVKRSEVYKRALALSSAPP